MDNKDLIPRIGTFFILVGLGLMALFVGSEFGKEPNFNFFFLSLAALFFGYLFRRKVAPPPASGRFAALRKAQEKSRQAREARLKKKAQKK